MNEQQPIGEPRMRKGFILSLGAFIVISVLVLAVLRASKNTPAHVAPPAGKVAGEVHPPTVVAEEPQANRFVDPTKLGQGQERPQVVRAKDSPLTDIKLTFKLDPRLTGSLYMGDRWVCPPIYYRTGSGSECSFEATIEGIDARGKAVRIQPTIAPADPSMVTVSPRPGKAVQITVHRPGQTSLEVAALGMSKKLPLNALAHGDSLVVEVYQQ